MENQTTQPEESKDVLTQAKKECCRGKCGVDQMNGDCIVLNCECHLEEKHPGGRPLKFKTAEELQEKIDHYFATTSKEEWTITGLALALDTSRQTLLEYEEKDEFADTVKKAKLKVENGYELDLKKHGRSGTIFALKNFNWKDKTESETTHKGEVSIRDLFDKTK